MKPSEGIISELIRLIEPVQTHSIYKSKQGIALAYKNFALPKRLKYPMKITSFPASSPFLHENQFLPWLDFCLLYLTKVLSYGL